MFVLLVSMSHMVVSLAMVVKVAVSRRGWHVRGYVCLCLVVRWIWPGVRVGDRRCKVKGRK